MCWNEEISLNTFIFSAGTLAFILYSNKYTQYRIPIFDNKYVILFVMLVISIQLIEYFLWKSLKTKNKTMNYTWSIICYIFIFLQPIATLMWVPNDNLRNILLTLYITIYGISAIANPIHFEAKKHKSGHLQWLFADKNQFIDNKIDLKNTLNLLATTIWFIAFFTGFYYLIDFPYFAMIVSLTILILLYYMYNDKLDIFNSNWCWLANGVALLLAFTILFVLPYREYKSIC